MLLAWNDLLLWQLRLPAAAKAAARVVSSQLSVLDSLVTYRRWPRITQRAGAVLRDKPTLLDDYVGAARAGDTATRNLHWHGQTHQLSLEAFVRASR